jgi:hypothetical protein
MYVGMGDFRAILKETKKALHRKFPSSTFAADAV